jgi:S-DNA-T family DNA segregation ATPase FtsK/SpoIIIE
MAKTKINNTKKKARHSMFDDFLFPFQDKRVVKISGIVLLAFSILLFVSFLSFFFSGGIDQSKLDVDALDYIMNSNIVVDNIAGKLGAFLSELFINKGFGLASFIFVYIFAVLGLKLLGVERIRTKKTIAVGLVGILWFSFLFAYSFDSFSSEIFVFPGGSYGYFLQKWFTAFIGSVGSLLFILVSFFIIMTFSFSKFFPAVTRFFDQPKRESISDLEDDGDNNEVDINNLVIDDDFMGNLPINDDIVNTDFEAENLEGEDSEEISLEIEDAIDEDSIAVESDDIEMTIENEGVNEELLKKNVVHLEDFDPTLELSNYKFPEINLLESHDANNKKVTPEELDANKKRIVDTLKNYKIDIVRIMATIGPTVTLYEIVPAPGVRVSKIKNLEDDIALSLSALGIRIIAPIPGRGTVGIEVPNLKPEIVSMKSIIASKKFQESDYALPIALGKTISNETFTFDLAKMPHLLVAGATGQGKSVGLNAIITSLLYKKHPSQLKFVMIDPKKVELSIYSVLEKYYLAKLPDTEDPIITDVGKVVATLNSLCIEMDNRYDLLKKAHVRNIKEYNSKFIKRKLNPEKGHVYLPYIVVIVDEFADLIMTAGKEVEQPIARIAQLARAVGIHMIIATQRPSTNIITGVIKANFPARLAFKVASMIDSRTILDTPGANQLIGRGDMLFSANSEVTRVQCAFVDTPEVEAITDSISQQKSYLSAFMLPDYVPESSGGDMGHVDLGAKDPLFDDAARLLVSTQQGSTSSIQRRFSIGYNRAGRIIDQLESAGVVGPFEGSKARQVLVPDEYSLEKTLNEL